MKLKDKIWQTGGIKDSKGRMINEDGVINFEVNSENDDTLYRYTILMDGASGLGKNNQISRTYTSAEWYVKFMLQKLQAIFLESPKKSIEEATKEAIEEAIKEINQFERKNNLVLAEYEKPSASLTILREEGKTTEIYSLGDTETIIGYKDGNIERVQNPNQIAVQKNDSEVLKRMIEIAREKRCDVIEAKKDEEIKRELQANRGKKNKECEGGYWVCGTNIEAAQHGISIRLENNQVDGIILASDGFEYSLLGMEAQEVYHLIYEKGADFVVRRLRDIEERDRGCNKWPRFKKSDDLTLVVLDNREREFDNKEMRIENNEQVK